MPSCWCWALSVWAACVAAKRRKPKRISSVPTITPQPPKQLQNAALK
nr:MAG TPA: hypothetical protein [Caudoviricetes sp.]